MSIVFLKKTDAPNAFDLNKSARSGTPAVDNISQNGWNVNTFLKII